MHRAFVLTFCLLMLGLSRPDARTASLPQTSGGTQSCDCPDIFDLVNRRNEIDAAIAGLTAKLAAWSAVDGGGAPTTTDANHAALNAELQVAINANTDEHANHGGGVTDAACETTNLAPTACLREAVAVHEAVHAAACRTFNASHPLSRFRWNTLADYATEDLAAYQAERAFVDSTLTRLKASCRFTLHVQSTIHGGVAVSLSEATVDVPIESSSTGFVPHGLIGNATLSYDTKDIGPPKKVGDPMLAKLIPVCYTAYTGKGQLPFDVTDGFMLRSKDTAHTPQIELWLKVGTSQETLYYKGERSCPRHAPVPGSFWSDMFVLAKKRDASGAILVDGWDYQPRPGVFAERVINSNCAAGNATSPALPRLGVGPVLCIEKTTLTLTKR